MLGNSKDAFVAMSAEELEAQFDPGGEPANIAGDCRGTM
jgi:hypothetical protein